MVCVQKTTEGWGYAADIPYRINPIQRSLGFPKSDFPELSPWVDEELSKDIQLKKEEQDEEWVEDWESPSTMYPSRT